jgi:hypothetical protein
MLKFIHSHLNILAGRLAGRLAEMLAEYWLLGTVVFGVEVDYQYFFVKGFLKALSLYLYLMKVVVNLRTGVDLCCFSVDSN